MTNSELTRKQNEVIKLMNDRQNETGKKMYLMIKNCKEMQIVSDPREWAGKGYYTGFEKVSYRVVENLYNKGILEFEVLDEMSEMLTLKAEYIN